MGMLQTRSSKNRQIAIYIFFAIFLVLVRSDLMEAESAPFDLVGPTIQMKVMRGGKTLPIANVPNLQVGDRLWVHADFPSYQSAHYVMIVAFLQGPTNPPPEDWFTRLETWNKSVREEGAFVNVPEHAEQALLLLVPDTSGAYGTVRSTVRGKPGIFVRATQDLEQASLDRTRIDKFLEEIKDGSTVDATPIPQRVGLLSRSLAVKADAECFNKPVEEQSTCLTQDTGRLVLQDTQSQSIVATLTSGPSADLVGSLSTTPVVRGGYYSPYVGSALDIARLLNTLHCRAWRMFNCRHCGPSIRNRFFACRILRLFFQWKEHRSFFQRASRTNLSSICKANPEPASTCRLPLTQRAADSRSISASSTRKKWTEK
jgi:hypothetical protein